MTLEPAREKRARERFVDVFLRETGVDPKHSATIRRRFEIRTDSTMAPGLSLSATVGQTYEMELLADEVSDDAKLDEQIDLFAEYVALNYRGDRVDRRNTEFEEAPQWPRDADDLR